jgi:hypothetical protein
MSVEGAVEDPNAEVRFEALLDGFGPGRRLHYKGSGAGLGGALDVDSAAVVDDFGDGSLQCRCVRDGNSGKVFALCFGEWEFDHGELAPVVFQVRGAGVVGKRGVDPVIESGGVRGFWGVAGGVRRSLGGVCRAHGGFSSMKVFIEEIVRE